MNTHMTTRDIVPKERIFTALLSFAVGSFMGYALASPPSIPYACHAPAPMRAHFLERSLSFDVSQLTFPKQPLRGAAEPEPTTEEGGVNGSSSSASSESSESSSESSAESASSSSGGSRSSESSVDVDIPGGFPAFGSAAFPVDRAPNWGAMKTPSAWNREYAEMERTDFVRVPSYDLDTLTTPMKKLTADRDAPENVRAITAKLFYSTRFFGSYDLDAGEFSGEHAGIDLKLPEGTPVGAVGGGIVASVRRDASGLGTHVTIEHRVDGETYYSIYGHLASAKVRAGEEVYAGQTIGLSGSTGRSTSGHLHLQIDRGVPGDAAHDAYWPEDVPDPSEADLRTVNPIEFIEAHR